MNLALLNPFRQPDRIDSTLSVPRAAHPPRPKEDNIQSTPQAGDGSKKKKKGEEPSPVATPAAKPTAGGEKSAATGEKKGDGKPPVAEAAAESGGNIIPTKDKSGEESTKKLFKQSLKLPLPASGEGDDGPKKKEAAPTAVSAGVAEAAAAAAALTTDADAPNTEGGAASLSQPMEVDAAADASKKEASTVAMDVDATATSAADVAKEASDKPKPPSSTAKASPKKRGRKKKTSPSPAEDDGATYWTACYAVLFSRRGAHLAAGHASGLVPVHDVAGRTLSALYRPPPGIRLKQGEKNGSVALAGFDYEDAGGVKEGKKKRGPKAKKGRKGKGKKEEAAAVKSTGADDVVVGPAVSKEGPAATPHKEVEEGSCDAQLQYVNGVTSLSWDRRGRTLLAGAIGDENLRLMDNTHPLAAAECTDAVRRRCLSEGTGKDVLGAGEAASSFEEKAAAIVARSPPLYATVPHPTAGDGATAHVKVETTSLGRARLLRATVVSTTEPESQPSYTRTPPPAHDESDLVAVPSMRHPTLVLALPRPLGGPAQLHPRDPHAGLAVLMDGSLALFSVPWEAYYEVLPSVGMTSEGTGGARKRVVDELVAREAQRAGRVAYLVPPGGEEEVGGPSSTPPAPPGYFVTCAAFGKRGDVVWAVTKCGTLLAYRLDAAMMDAVRGRRGAEHGGKDSPLARALVEQRSKPALRVQIPGGAAAWQIIVSRNGRHLLINSADCALRLYDVDELMEVFAAEQMVEELTKAFATAEGTRDDDPKAAPMDVEPRFVFQDTVSKAPWAACDFSGDGEYVVGGCNSYPQPGDNYKLFLWNCVTGELADQLTGPVSSLYSLSCHPTRPFIAVGTSDGLVDVWGARLDWVAFAPDFQALQQNELYEEREDEFDIVVDNEGAAGDDGKQSGYNQLSPEDEDVDITTIDKVPAFDSDSEDEDDVFYFDTRVEKILSESKQPGPKKAEE